MSHIELSCTSCGASRTSSVRLLRCRDCSAPLHVAYRKESADFPGAQPAGWRGSPVPSPIHDPGALVDLGEGHTPAVRLPALEEAVGVRELIGKLEFLNPTGSFKDRGSSVMVAVAREHGVRALVEDSSGNAGASVAAYAARAGMEAHVFVPSGAPAAKIGQIRVYGAKVHTVEGSREAVGDAAAAFAQEHGLVYASHSLSPYFLEGTKMFAYEVLEQFGEELPEHIVMPVGNGGLYLGTWKGFRELAESRRITRIPRLHCVQARAVMPVVAAFRGEDWSGSSGSTTVAGGIAVAAPARKAEIMDVVRESGGSAVAVEDADILAWQRSLAEREGIYAEPTSAAALAGLSALVRAGAIERSDRVLVPLTGFGMKDAPPS